MKKLRVAVNGYGVIGKRIADAVKAQQDMELVGVAQAANQEFLLPALLVQWDADVLRG